MAGLLTLSVVLPCAFEYAFMERTARSVWEATPAERLKEIVIVDDASDPPLEHFAAAELYKVRFIVHPKPLGLIGAKRTGGDAAVGDVIVFFDCHVKPDANYWIPFVKHLEANPRRVVVPVITELDVDKWQEVNRPRGGGMSKCYLTFDAQFKWTDDNTDFVPLMSGGLLAMRKTWWDELSGLDPEMRGWGGENIDQSLRIWRCGGEIVSAPDSYVAHMWRDARKPQTLAKYHLMPGSTELNIARAARAHFGEAFFAKTLQFPPYRRFVGREPNASAIEGPLRTCANGQPAKSFEWYLRRFRYIYRDAGVLPTEIFQIEYGDAGLCLDLAGGTREWGSALQPYDTVTATPCEPGRKRDSGQWWHLSNRGTDGKCCSGLKAWNTDQCLIQGKRSAVETSVCNLAGPRHQRFRLDATRGLLFGEQCVSKAADGHLAIGACGGGAAVWRKRRRSRPAEFNALSAAMQRRWLSPIADSDFDPPRVAEL